MILVLPGAAVLTATTGDPTQPRLASVSSGAADAKEIS